VTNVQRMNKKQIFIDKFIYKYFIQIVGTV